MRYSPGKIKNNYIKTGDQVTVIPEHEEEVETDHIPMSEYAAKFEKQLKLLKKQVQAISMKNAINEPRKSSHDVKKALSDMDAIYCRVNRKDYTIRQLALKFKVSERCVTRCVRGDTYKHLNSRYKPWF